MKGRSAAAFGSFLACLGCGLVSSAQAASPADWMYEPTTFTEVNLTLPPSSVATLEVEPEVNYVPGTFSIAETDGTPGSAGPFSTPIEVGIRLKGGDGSFRNLGEKAAFKVKFDSFVKAQTFDGLEKLTLNNMVQDNSMLHEMLAYQAFHELGVPAPHAGFSYLRVNGKSYGLHLNIETQDKDSLEKEFGPFLNPPQHLYEGEYGADVSTENWRATSEKKWQKLEVQEGKKKEKKDLEALVAKVAEPSPSFSQRMVDVADLNEMTRMWMVEKYIGYWDGYSGEPADAVFPNNYYLYSDATGKFQMLPWGTDQTWEDHLDFAGDGGLLFHECLADAPGCKSTYLAAGDEALTRLSSPELATTARCIGKYLTPWQQLEATESEPQRLPFASVGSKSAEGRLRSRLTRRSRASCPCWAAPPRPTVPSRPAPVPRSPVLPALSLSIAS
jgi:hypothetical protein